MRWRMVRQSRKDVEIRAALANPAKFPGLFEHYLDRGAEEDDFAVLSPLRDTGGLPRGARFGLEDESARINLNVVLWHDDERENGAREVLMALPGMTREIADAMLDWLDADDKPREFGCEADYYAKLNPPRRPANGPLTTLSQALQVRGVTRELMFGRATAGFALPARDAKKRLSAPQGQVVFDGGWAALLTLYSAEGNGTADGKPRIDLNNDNLERLYEQLSKAFDAEWATYIVAYRQNGATIRTEGLTAESRRGGLDLTRPARVRFANVLDVVGIDVVARFTDEDAPVLLRSPFPSPERDPGGSASLSKLLDYTTVSAAPSIVGRVNVNQAPRAVLETIPGLTKDAVTKILRTRAELSDEESRHPTWLLTKEIVTLEEMRRILTWTTTGGDVYRACLVRPGAGGKSVPQSVAIIDATVGQANTRPRADVPPRVTVSRVGADGDVEALRSRRSCWGSFGNRCGSRSMRKLGSVSYRFSGARTSIAIVR